MTFTDSHYSLYKPELMLILSAMKNENSKMKWHGVEFLLDFSSKFASLTGKSSLIPMLEH